MSLFGREREAVLGALDAAQDKLDQADVAGANAAIAEVRTAISGIPEAVEDVRAIIAEMKDAPDWLRKLAEAGQADAEKALLAIGHYGELAQKLSNIVAGLRDGRWIEAQNVRFTPDGISGRVRIVP